MVDDDELLEQVALIILEAQVGGCTRYEAAERICALFAQTLEEQMDQALLDALDETLEEMG